MKAPSHAPEPAANVLRWVHAPLQARTREGLARLLEAAEELIAEKGFDESSITEIAQRGGTSVGGFYRRFHDKDGLIQALHQTFCDDSRATADDALDPARWEGAPLTLVVRDFTAFLVQIFREREGLLRAFLSRANSDLVMRERTRALFDHLSLRLSALLLTRQHEIDHADPQLAAAFGLQMLLGTLDYCVLLPHQPLPLGDDRFVNELARAFGSYLGVRAEKPRLTVSRPKRRKQ